MKGEKLFGISSHPTDSAHEGQGLKLVLHRYIIDAIEETGKNLLEGSRPALAQFVTDKVAEYIARLHLAISRYEMERLAEELVDELTGYGPLEVLLRDKSVTEILVNGPNKVFIERDGVLHHTDLRFIDAHHVERVMQRILAPLGRRLDESSPMVDARLADGSRVNAVIEPLSIDGPTLTIRRFGTKRLHVEDLIRLGAMTPPVLDFLRAAVEARQNIRVSGGTGSGKTTLLNVLSSFIPRAERILTIEDVAELKLDQPHVVRLEARPPNLEGTGGVTISDLVSNALRMRPDRIVIGECRGGEALDMLQAMNTGHDGSLTTIHANTARDALSRVETMVMMSGYELPLRAIRQQAASAIDLVIQVARLRDGSRRVTGVSEII